MRKIAFLLAFLMFLAFPVKSQTSVSLMPQPRIQWFLPNGSPNAGGCLFFFLTGTSTPAPTFVDVNGVILNSNPVILDSSGYSTVYLENIEYRVTEVSAGGVNCASGSQIWSQDGVSAYQILSGSATIIFAGVTSDPTGQAGMVDYRTDLACLRLFTTSWDCITTNNAIETLTNKTLTAPTITNPTVTGGTFAAPTIGGTLNQNGPATYITMINEGVTGTAINQLVKLTAAQPSTAIQATTTDKGGIIGVCVAGCGTTGSATIQQSGQTACAFDAVPITDGDYIQISALTNGFCSDAGATYPTTNGQVMGRVISVSTNPRQIILFGPEIKPTASTSASVACTVFAPVTVTNNNATQNLQSCAIAANTLVAGSELSIDIVGVESTAGAQTITIGTSLGGGAVCSTVSGTTGVVNNVTFNAQAKLVVLTAGVAGTANIACEYFSITNGGGVVGGTILGPTFALNTTALNTLQITTTMSVANPGNSVTEQMLKAVLF